MSTSISNEYRGPKGPLWEWTARVRVDNSELETVTSVCIFLGEPPEDPKDWLLAPNLAGAHHILVSRGTVPRRTGGPGGGTGYGSGHGSGGYGSRHSASASEGAAASGRITQGFVHLNHAISRLSGLGSFDPEVIVPYLEDKLEWRAQKADTTPIEVDSLEIVILATPMTYPPGGMFPVPGKRRQYNHITYGRPGGSRDCEDQL